MERAGVIKRGGRAWALLSVAFLLSSGGGPGRAQDAARNVGAVVLTVRGPDGKPLRGHAVTVSQLGPWPAVLDVSAVTDGQGRITVSMPVGQMRLRVRADGVGFGGTGVVEVGPGQDVSATLPPLAPFARLSGTVAPAFRRPGQILRLENEFGRPGADRLPVPVDAQGRFTLRDLPPGRVGIGLDQGTPAKNYYFQFQIAPGEVREGITLAPSSSPSLFPPYVAPPDTRTVTLRGTVTDDQRRPVAGATVYAQVPDPQPGGGGYGRWPWGEPAPISTVTGADGGYTFPDVTVSYSALTIPLAASAPGHPPAFASVRNAPDAPGEARADLVLSTQHTTLTVRVTTPDGRPAAGAAVHLWPEAGIPDILAGRTSRAGDRPDSFAGFGTGQNKMSRLSAPSGIAGPDGMARFADFLPGLWDVEASDAPEPGAAEPPRSARSATSRGVVVQAGREAACTLALFPATTAPTVRVLSPDGRSVAVQGAYLEPGSAITDTRVFGDHNPNTADAPSDAPLTIGDARRGLWRVTANYRNNSQSNTQYGSYIPEPYIAAGALVALSPALPPPGPLVLRARNRSAGTLRVRLEGVDGRPAAGTVYVPGYTGAPEYATTVNAQGEAVFAAMPAGTYTVVGRFAGQATPPTLAVQASSDDGPLPTDAALVGWSCPVPQQATVALDAETRVVLRAVPTGFVRGRIVPAAGTPLSHYSLMARYLPGNGEASAAGKINPETGEFVYGPLPPGPAPLPLECMDIAQKQPFPVSTVTAGVIGGKVTHLAPLVASPLVPDISPGSVRGVVLLHDGVAPAWSAQAVLFLPSPYSLTDLMIAEQAPADALGQLNGQLVPAAGAFYHPDKRGATVLTGPEPDAPTLVVWMPGLTGAALAPYVKGRDVRVILPPPNHIAGRVTIGGRSARGLPGTIRVLAAYRGRGRLGALFSRDMTARPDGTFTLDGLTPGTYRVQAARDGIWLSQTLPLTVGASPPSPSPLTLDIAPPGVPVVLHMGGVPGQTVTLDRPAGPLTEELWPITVATDGAGDLRLDGLEAGRHTVVPAGGSPVVFDVPPVQLRPTANQQ